MATAKISDLTLKASPLGTDLMEIEEASGGLSKHCTLASLMTGGGGMTSLNGLTGTIQTITNDANVTVVSGGTAHVITWSGQLSVARGGTSFSGYTTGDIIYASGAGTLAKRGIGSNGQVLTVVAGVPNWQAQTVTASALAIYGDGSDGSAVLDGVNTFTWCSLAGSTYTMTRDAYLNNLTVNAAKILVGKYRIFGLGTLTNNGTIHNNGADGNSFVGGGGAGQGFYAPSANGGGSAAGSGSSTVAGTNGDNTGNTSTIVTLGGAGGAGGGANGGTGGALQSVTSLTGVGSIRNLIDAISGHSTVSSTSRNTGPSMLSFNGGSGGGGGGRTTGGTSTQPGAGGGAAGQMLICFRTIVNTAGIISCNGGNGVAATGGTCVTGGGGGGGGGLLVLIYDSFSAGTETVNGGALGAGINGASAAVNGAVGTKITMQNI